MVYPADTNIFTFPVEEVEEEEEVVEEEVVVVEEVVEEEEDVVVEFPVGEKYFNITCRLRMVQTPIPPSTTHQSFLTQTF